ncbi:hypothetical protein ABN028_28835 [Actinopolymorpha sp. B17G11]|uniref:hypothetical protein n=1 Tax=unclassified Actinopolymorpha TaxID=2627063 RepID=UPI0032D92A63
MLVTLWIALVAAVLAGSLWWTLAGRHQATPWVVEGYALGGPAAVSLHDASMEKFNNEGFVPAGAMWRVKDGTWHDDGDRSCLKNMPNTRQHVRMGIIENRGPGGGRWAVVWIECLD